MVASPQSPPPTRILFVCLGNICRSPLAEGIFLHLVKESGLEGHYQAESAGTGGWHVGECADPRTIEVAERNGVRLEGTARQMEVGDFTAFDLIFAMDRANLQALQQLGGEVEAPAPVRLLRELDPEAGGDLDVPDPYYGGPGGFEDVFRMVRRSCAHLLERLESERASRDR